MSSEPTREAQQPNDGKPPKRRPLVIRIFPALKRHRNRYVGRNQKLTSDHQINERVMARWTRCVGVFTGALVGVGIATAVIFLRQLDVMQGQLDEMRNEQRPWVSASFAVGSVEWKDGEARILVAASIKNTGHSPGISVSIEPEAYESLNLNRALSKQREAMNAIRQRGDVFATPVFPGDISQRSWNIPLAREEIEDFQKTLDSVKGASNVKPAGPSRFVPAVISVVIDYKAVGRSEHHQTCYLLGLNFRDSSIPNAPMLALPVGRNLAAQDLALIYEDITQCAD